MDAHLKDLYNVEKDHYKNYIEPLYLKHFEVTPKYYIRYDFLLPFSVPFTSSHIMTSFDLEYSNQVSFDFEQKEYHALNSNPINKSLCSMKVLIHPEFKIDLSDNTYKAFFEYGLGYLNNELLAYSLAYRDYQVTHISRNQIEGNPYFVCLDFNNDKLINKGVITFKDGGVQKPINFNDDLKSLQKLEHVLINRLPFKINLKLISNLYYNYYIGDDVIAVILCESLIESWLRTLISEAMFKNSATDEEVQNFHNKYSLFNKLVTFVIENKLFHIDKETNVYKDWNSKLYKLRNKISHEGYVPEETESYEAIKSGIEYFKYIHTSINDKVSEYKHVKDVSQFVVDLIHDVNLKFETIRIQNL